MSKKSSKRKKTGSKKAPRRKSSPRKGKKAPFKQHGSRGIRASQARANKAKRTRKAANAKASKKARRFSGVSIPVPAGYKGPLPGVSAAGVVALTPAARKRARKAAAASVASGTATVVVPIPAGYTGALPGVGAAISKPAGKKRRGKKKAAMSAPRVGKKRRAKKKAAAASAAPKKARRRTGRAKPGSTQKMKLMHKWGFPRGTRAAISKVRKAELRHAAGHGGSGPQGRITFNDIMNTIQNEKLKSWVCVGPRRSGCGGGAKNLRGGHQIGIFGSGN